jgi:hypothetical protein
VDVDTPIQREVPLPRRSDFSPRRIVFLLAAIGGLGVLVIAAYPPIARWLTRSQGEHLTVAEARSRVRLDLPDGASDIRFYQHLRPDQEVMVDFAITESDFQMWAASQGWETEHVVGSITI